MDVPNILVAAPTLAPQSVVTTAIDSKTLSISWVPPPFVHQNGII